MLHMYICVFICNAGFIHQKVAYVTLSEESCCIFVVGYHEWMRTRFNTIRYSRTHIHIQAHNFCVWLVLKCNKWVQGVPVRCWYTRISTGNSFFCGVGLYELMVVSHFFQEFTLGQKLFETNVNTIQFNLEKGRAKPIWKNLQEGNRISMWPYISYS